MNKGLWLIFLILIPFTWTSCGNPGENISGIKVEEKDPLLFEFLSPEASGIDFTNQLTEGPNTNVLMYEYFYNGGGVAIGDVNGDGLEDIYFSGNMVPNKLYLNKGSLQFDDITKLAGVEGREGPWATGVVMADVNGDGLLDIYVCYSGNLPAEKRKNQLFINTGSDENGIPKFIEKSSEFGLDIDSYSTHALFFDYDLDGDLDMFLLNHNPKSLPVLDEASTADLLSRADPAGSQLFENRNGRFIEVTQKAGIQNSALSYGLGVGAADLSGNGYPDLYVSNDYTATDYLYFNNGDGTFTEVSHRALGHISQFSMGNELADFNNDGLVDIFTLDMLPEDNARQKLLMSPDNFEKFQFMVNAGLHYQYMRNMLHLNHGNGRFSEVGQIKGVSNTDWSWAALLADFDNDGWKDLFVTNGYRKDYTNLDFLKYMGDFIRNQQGNLKRENILELVSKIPASDISNYIFKNNQGKEFSNVTSKWGLEMPINSNGAAYADLDNDGDLDLIINNVDAPSMVFENKTNELKPDNNFLQIQLEGDKGNRFGIGAKIFLYQNNSFQLQEQMPSRGYQSNVSYKIHFGIGDNSKIDSVKIIWPDGSTETNKNVKSNTLVSFSQQNATSQAPDRSKAIRKTLFKNTGAIGDPIKGSRFNDFKRQALMPNQISGTKIAMAKGDLNGDGLEDILVGGLSGQQAQLFLQTKNGGFTKGNAGFLSESIASEDTDAHIFDANGNGLMDIFIASGGYGDFNQNDNRLLDRLYINQGNGQFELAPEALPKAYNSTSVAAVHDFNGDGFPDLFIGSRVIPGQYPLSGASRILENNKDGTFKEVTSTLFPELSDIGMVNDAKWFDLDGNGSKELIVVGEWMPIRIFAFNQRKFEDVTSKYLDKVHSGWWNTIFIENMGENPNPVLIVGNYGLNSQLKASEKEPVAMHYKDFDDNGSIDPILTSFIQGESYPYLTRDELLDHFTGKRSKFPSYSSYANATLNDVFSTQEMEGVGMKSAVGLDTKMFVLDSDKRFREVKLPIEVQYAPVHKIISLENGNRDYLLFLGNTEHARLKLGKNDANHGVLIAIDDPEKPSNIPNLNSGFSLSGMSLNGLNIGNNLILLNVMGQSIQIYEPVD